MSISLHFQAVMDLLRRYRDAIGHAWEHRKAMDHPERRRHEAEFLPAALALQETPVSPAPRVAMWLLIAFACIAVAWAIFGHVDVVATAQGKTVPNERVKVIQPLETAVVKAVYVTDGQRVKAGDVLIDLDTESTGADTKRLENDLTVARLQAARAEAFLDALDGQDPQITSVPDIDPVRVRDEQRHLSSQWHEYKTKLERMEADITGKEAEERSIQETVLKFERTLPITKNREAVFKSLWEKEVVSEQQYREQEKTLIEQESDLAATLERLKAVHADLEEARKERNAFIAEIRRTQLDVRHEAEQKAQTNAQELAKARRRHQLMQLCAPVDGSVQQLAIHTRGGVVTPAQQLMVIVPKDDPLEVEAFLENKDVGFVEAGQEAEIKIETFPYTKYGTIHGEVKSVSEDAIQDEKKGLIYSARINLDKTTVRVENRTVNLAPGMAVTAEIKTGKRRVIEYFLTPLLQHSKESMRER